MPIIKKYAEGQTTNLQPRLTTYQTYVVDNSINSDYFRITEFKDTFTGGKNGFLIEGSQHLLESTEIKIEILDVDGNPIYYEPGNGVPEYYEGLSKPVAVYIYQDTPIGQGKITILGELKTYIDEGGVVRDVPAEWKGIYNVKWERNFQINRFLANKDTVRFYKRPNISITEIVKPIFTTALSTLTQKGKVIGTSIIPQAGQRLSSFTPPFYKLTTTDNTFWTSSIVDTVLKFDDDNYNPLVDSIINSRELFVSNPYVNPNTGLVSDLDEIGYTASFNYVEGIERVASALTGSFAKISITDLTTFIGDVKRVKIYRKSQSQVGDYQFVQEVILESNELLVDLDSQNSVQDNYGIFTEPVIRDYWVTSSNAITTTFNQNYLFDSVKLNSSTPKYFHTTKSISITEGAEYTLNFNLRVSESIDSSNYIRAFLSGSKTTTINGVPTKVQVEQTISTIASQNSLLEKSTSNENIIAQKIDDAKLYFEVLGNNWYVSNVSFAAAQETAFSPDEVTFIQSVPRSLATETFTYLFEFWGGNNQVIPVLVEESKTFDGGNLQRIQKQLRLVPSSLYFQFDSGSNPVPPTIITIDVQKTLLTGSVTFTSSSIDFDGNTLTYDDYTASFTGKQYPGLLSNVTSDQPYLTVQNFTGSRTDKTVQYLQITGEVEGYTDTIVISRVLDGFGGVNHLIRPYRGTDIRNSSTQSLEIQAVRIDGVNDIELSSTTQPGKGWPVVQLHVLSASADKEYFINLEKAVAQNYIQGLSVGELGSKELNYNAVFNRDSIDKRRTVYLIKSGSITDQPAYIASSSILSSIVLSDLQDGLDAGFVAYDTDVFNINFRNGINFAPVTASVTASFYLRGTNSNPLTASLTVFPSMSINKDFVPEYWVYFVTHSSTWDKDITITATDDNNFLIKSGGPNSFYGSYVRSPLSQSKTLTTTFKYTEPYTLTEVTVDKTFTIVPAGKPGDESIVFEINPQNVSLKSNAKGEVISYQPSITDIRLKQGSRYLLFTSSISQSGTFHIAQSSIVSSSITGGLVYFDNGYTSSLIVSASRGLCDLSGSLTFPLIIHPYYTSSIYTQSIVQNFTKVLDGAPQLEVLLSPISPTLNADEVSYVTDYKPANTQIKIKEGFDYLVYSTGSTAPGTFRINAVNTNNISVLSPIQGANTTTTASVSFNRFDYPHVSASANYIIQAYPYSLGPGHQYTASILNVTQNFTKNVASVGTRNVTLAASSTTVNFDGDGVRVSPLDPVILTATAYGTTGSAWFQFFKDDVDYSGILGEDAPNGKVATLEIGAGDEVSPQEIATWEVRLRDGNSSPGAIVRATDSLTIAGIKEGATSYNVILTNENCSATYRVSGQFTTTGTGTQVKATKGDVPLLHKTAVADGGPGFSAKTTDQFGNDIGSIGEYQVTVFSKSAHVTLEGGTVAGASLDTFNDVAIIGNISSWDNPETNPVAEVVYQVNLENGRLLVYKTQSLSIQYEGATGPGIVMRGEWSASIDYSGSVETENYRRDAVIYGTNPTTYYAAVSGSGPHTYSGDGILVGAKQPTAGGDNAWWQYLGEQEFFVAAKIAIFDESYVKNTINVGNNGGNNAFANIVLAGGRPDPYMSIAQYSAIGYDQTGIWLGVYELPAGAGYKPRFSLKNTAGNRYLRWTGDNLEIAGSITVTGGDAATQSGVSGSVSSGSYSAFQTASGSAATAMTLFSGSLGAMAAINSINAGNDALTYIGEGAIVTSRIATNAIRSVNYTYSSGNFTTAGSFFNLATGEIITPGFAVKASGDAYFKGVIEALSGKLGAWKLDANTIANTNDKIILDSTNKSISVFDDGGSLRFQANTNTSLPIIGGGAPSPASITVSSNTDKTYTEYGSFSFPNEAQTTSGTDYYDFGTFTTATTPSTPTAKHIASYTYNPASTFSSYASSTGAAYGTIYATLVFRKDSDGSIAATGTSRGAISYGGITCGDEPGGIPSVIGSTKIILSDGSIKLAKDIVKDEKILAWDEISDSFVEGVISQIKTRKVNLVYKINCGGSEVEVSDSHKFWGIGNTEILATELVAGTSKIFIRTGNSIELKIVDGVEIIYKNEDVFTFSVPNYNNYISNEIISHNAPGYCYGTGTPDYFTDPDTFVVIGDLSQNTTYRVSLKIDYNLECTYTTGTPYYVSSEAVANFRISSGEIVTIQRVDAGVIANGGGFQAVASSTNYIRVSVDATENGQGGSSYNKTFGPQIKGNLNLRDGKIISDSSTQYGWGPAVKAFGSIRYTGTSGNTAQMQSTTNYTIDGAYGVATNAITSINTTYASYLLTFPEDIGTSNYEFIFTSSNIDYTSNSRTNVPMILAKSSTYVIFRIMALNNTAKYIAEGFSNGYVDFVIIGK